MFDQNRNLEPHPFSKNGTNKQRSLLARQSDGLPPFMSYQGPDEKPRRKADQRPKKGSVSKRAAP
jgi:hypothetical protein